MGMYDDFEVPPDTSCPKCEEPVSGLQTKALPQPSLRLIKLHKSPDTDELHITEGSVEAHTSCRKCHAWLEYQATISDGKYVGVELMSAQTPEEKREGCC